jgi:hypothetical protein
MSFEDELSDRLSAAGDEVSVAPDLADVQRRAGTLRRRRQGALGAGIAALGALTVGALVIVAERPDRGEQLAEVEDSSPDSAVDVATTDVTEPSSTTIDAVDSTEPILSTPAEPDATIVLAPEPMAPATTTPAGVDLATPYLEGATEVYRRTLPTGEDFVAMVSDRTYASLFGIEWRAPTGSADDCLGDRAVFIGVPPGIGWWGSAWVATRWFDEVDLTTPVVVASMQPASFDVATVPPSGNAVVDPGLHVLLRVSPGVAEVIASTGSGAEIDRAEVVNGLAMIVAPSYFVAEEVPTIRLVSTDGRIGESAPIDFDSQYEQRPDPPSGPCGPGDPPVLSLPEPGAQPDDPARAEREIRQRHALLVDRSIPADSKPPALLDDDTGVDAAVAQARGGGYSEAVASATYSIDEVVFTEPDTAWFTYTIEATTGTFGPRFGVATFNGDVWQISRSTLCNDLSLAGASCVPAPPPLRLPNQDEFDRAYDEWVERAQLYTAGDGCPPLSPC